MTCLRMRGLVKGGTRIKRWEIEPGLIAVPATP
jgi:hypothetical protein